MPPCVASSFQIPKPEAVTPTRLQTVTKEARYLLVNAAICHYESFCEKPSIELISLGRALVSELAEQR